MLDDALSDALDLSKWRCKRDYGLESTQPLKTTALSEIEIQERRQALSPTLGRNTGSLSKLRQLAKDAGYCLLITDADCVVVEAHADTPEARSYVQAGLRCGTVWQEARAGTNGLGLCAETHRVVTVAGQDHFFETFHNLACTAAPILDDKNRLIGIVNMTGTDRSFDLNGGFVRQILKDAIEQIQAEIFRRSVGEDLLIEVRDGVATRPNALLSLTEDGMISRITQSAADVLATGLRPEDLTGQFISNFVAIDVDDMAPMIGRTQYVQLIGKGSCFLTPQVPPVKMGPARHLRDANRPRPSPANNIYVGTDSKLQRSFSLARRMFENGIAIMLQEESGTGKVSIAHELHRMCRGTKGQVTLIDCAVVDVEELSAKVTRFLDQPHDQSVEVMQTLLLREIGALPQRQQAVLFGLLNQHKNRRLERQIISTTSRQITEPIGPDGIIPELLHTLKGAAIAVPPLRDRSDLESILAKCLSDLTESAVEFSQSARTALLLYSWPGNFPELINALRFGTASRVGDKIEREDLPQEIWSESGRQMQFNSGSIPPNRVASTQTLMQSRTDAERKRVRQALLMSGWNVSDAAQSIGISRATMHRKMKAFGIGRPSGNSS